MVKKCGCFQRFERRTNVQQNVSYLKQIILLKKHFRFFTKKTTCFERILRSFGNKKFLYSWKGDEIKGAGIPVILFLVR